MLESAKRIVGFVTRWSLWLGMGWVMAMMLLTTADVGMRYFFSKPIPGSVEINEFLLAIFAILGLSHTQKMGANVRVTMVLNVLRGRPKIAVEIFTQVLCLCVIGLLAGQSCMMGIEEIQSGTTTDRLKVPIYPLWFLLSFGSFSLVLEMLMQTADSVASLFKPHKGN